MESYIKYSKTQKAEKERQEEQGQQTEEQQLTQQVSIPRRQSPHWTLTLTAPNAAPNADRNVEPQEPSLPPCRWECQCCSLLGRPWRFLQKQTDSSHKPQQPCALIFIRRNWKHVHTKPARRRHSSGFPRNCPSLEATQMPFSRWVCGQTVLHPHSGILFSTAKDELSCHEKNMEEPWGHTTKWKKPIRNGCVLYVSNNMTYRKGKSVPVVARVQEEGKDEQEEHRTPRRLTARVMPWRQVHVVTHPSTPTNGHWDEPQCQLWTWGDDDVPK